MCLVSRDQQADSQRDVCAPRQYFPLWVTADINAYYHYCGTRLVPLISELDNLLSDNNYINNRIDEIYNHIISILVSSERYYIPRHNKNFYKFCWNEELDILKQDAIESLKLIVYGK